MPCKVREKGMKEGNKAKENLGKNQYSFSQISVESKPIDTQKEIAKGEGM